VDQLAVWTRHPAVLDRVERLHVRNRSQPRRRRLPDAAALRAELRWPWGSPLEGGHHYRLSTWRKLIAVRRPRSRRQCSAARQDISSSPPRPDSTAIAGASTVASSSTSPGRSNESPLRVRYPGCAQRAQSPRHQVGVQPEAQPADDRDRAGPLRSASSGPSRVDESSIVADGIGARSRPRPSCQRSVMASAPAIRHVVAIRCRSTPAGCEVLALGGRSCKVGADGDERSADCVPDRGTAGPIAEAGGRPSPGHGYPMRPARRSSLPPTRRADHLAATVATSPSISSVPALDGFGLRDPGPT
jgi:hypothetical protein